VAKAKSKEIAMKSKIQSVLMILIFSLVFAAFSGCDLIAEKNQANLFIYEVYTSGGYSSGENYAPYLNSYVVLHNESYNEISLEGWYLSSTGADLLIKEERCIALSGSIPPQGFHVIEGGHAVDAGLQYPLKVQGELVYVGDDLPFDIDLSAQAFVTDRKQGAIVLSSSKLSEELSSDDEAIEDMLVYGLSSVTLPDCVNDEPAKEPSVKKVLRRVRLSDSNNSRMDFDTKDIVDKPGNIIFWADGMTTESLYSLTDWSDSTVTLSSRSGYYSEAFDLALSTNLGEGVIYYTVDGTAPISPLGVISESAVKYTSPIHLYDRTGDPARLMHIEGTTLPETNNFWPPAQMDGETDQDYEARMHALYTSTYKANVIRAAAINDDKAVTAEAIGTYFVGEKSLGERYGMPVIEITTNPDYLYNGDSGIFMGQNAYMKGNVSQVPAFIQYFDTNSDLAFSQTASLQVHGNVSRNYAKKGLRINMSDKKFSYDLFNGLVKNQNGNIQTYFDRFILRNGFGDFYGMNDTFWERFYSKLGTFGVQASVPITVFLNGEYWGTYNLTERQDEYYVEAHYGVAREDVLIVENFAMATVGSESAVQELIDIQNFVLGNDMKASENYARFTDLVDVSTFVDYFICEIYAQNYDWLDNNVKCWKSMNPDDGKFSKWQMMMTDLDHSGRESSFDNYLNSRFYDDKAADTAKMFLKLMENQAFKTQFMERFNYLLDNFFLSEDLLACLDEVVREIATARMETYMRWNENNNIEYWESDLLGLRESIKNRTEGMREYLQRDSAFMKP
jgi:hypothetical protein